MAGENIATVPAGFPETFDPDNLHPEYEAWRPSWIVARDAFDGEEAVKGKTTEYLPQPRGMEASSNPSGAYEAYKLRAQVPELMGLTVRGLAGVIHRKPAIYTMPGGLDGITEVATIDRLPLATFHRRVTTEVLKVGRYGVLTDAPRVGGFPYLTGYVAETIIDWEVGDDGELDLVVLDESGPRRRDGIWKDIKRWRRLIRFLGSYWAEAWESDGTEPLLVERVQPTAKNGQGLPRIPFVFVGTSDLSAAPDDVPLTQVARSELAIYRLDADYRQSLFMTAQPTPVVIGVSDNDRAPRYMGSSVAWLLPPGADAKILEFTGSGINALRTAIRDEFALAVMAGARMLEEGSDAAESGRAKEIRYGAQTATVTTIAQTTAAGLERALQHVAAFTGAAEAEVKVVANIEFVESRLEPSEISTLIESWLKGAISKITLFENLQRGKIIADGKTFDAEEQEIDETAPDLPPPEGEDEPPADEDAEDAA